MCVLGAVPETVGWYGYGGGGWIGGCVPVAEPLSSEGWRGWRREDWLGGREWILGGRGSGRTWVLLG